MAVIKIPCPKCGHGNSVYDEETVECEYCHSTVSITCPALTGTVELVPIIDD